MRGVLEFTLPDDEHEHILACNAGALYAALNEAMEYLRREIKNDQDTSAETIREKIWSIIDDQGITGLFI